MPKELLTRTQLEQSETGSYFISHKDLVAISLDGWLEFEYAASRLIRMNPDYIFTTFYDPVSGGMVISWRKNGFSFSVGSPEYVGEESRIRTSNHIHAKGAR